MAANISHVPDLRDLAAQERAELESVLTVLTVAGVDIGDSEALSRFCDEQVGEWHRLAEDRRPDPAAVIERSGPA
jgi:hypothetical protein